MSVHFYLSLSLLQKPSALILSLCTFPSQTIVFRGAAAPRKSSATQKLPDFPRNFYVESIYDSEKKQNKSNQLTLTLSILMRA